MKRKKPDGRLIIIGLTGSIGMGKSTVTQQFARFGAATCDSDLIVHRLLGKGGAAVEKVSRLFPETLKNGVVDRTALGSEVFGNQVKLKALEAIIHPLVRVAQERFIRAAKQAKKKFTVLDIPLLFETGAEKRCHAVVVATAPYTIQKQRVLSRTGMTQEKFERIMALQMKDSEKRRRADFIVQTGQGKYVSLRAVRRILATLAKKSAKEMS